MNQLRIFDSAEFGRIRAFEVEGKPYFVASDVAKTLGYENTSKAIRDHCKCVTKRSIPHPQSTEKQIEVNVIPEGDVYRLICHSKLPAAERFERWVFEEVLPSIRANGGYLAGQDTLSEDELILRALEVAQNKLARNERQLEQMRPKALFADAVAASHTSILIGDLAKLLKQNGVEIGQKRLFAWLRENGYLIRRKGADWNMPTQKAMERRLFEVKESTVNNPDGSVKINRTTKVTGKGQLYFINRFLQKPCAGLSEQSHDLRLDRPE